MNRMRMIMKQKKEVLEEMMTEIIRQRIRKT
jgi:hypothetical protein